MGRENSGLSFSACEMSTVNHRIVQGGISKTWSVDLCIKAEYLKRGQWVSVGLLQLYK